ncbi:MAG: dynamin family protein [Actinomycetaceae bacterium]|nr:dynamin family protein [Actinomycetaceae bacterium]
MAQLDPHSSLDVLGQALEESRLALQTPRSSEAEGQRLRALRRLNDHIRARVDSLESPLLTVIGGSTGAGKSTLLNSLLGRSISASSPVRPTTRRPVLVHHPNDAHWFSDTRILQGLARVHVEGDAAPTPAGTGTTSELEVRPNTHIPAGMAVLDSPDIDSVSEQNRALSRQLLDAADLWLFVTTAARYADAVPWELLREAARRGVLVGIVLNRVPAGAEEAIGEDLRRLLASDGLGGAPVFIIGEQDLADGLLPEAAFGQVRVWLEGLAADAAQRAGIALKALGGSLKEVLDSADQVSAALEEAAEVRGEAESVLDKEVEDALARLKLATADGSLLRGEVLARWQDVVGAADFTRDIGRFVGQLRDRITAFFRGKPAPVAPVEDALQAGLAALIHEELVRVREEAEATWRLMPAVAPIVRALPPVDEAAMEQAAIGLTRQWQRDLLEMVRNEGAEKRSNARIAAIGVNVVSVALIIAVFASTGGLTGVDVGISGASAVVAQKVLEAVFGDQSVRTMAKRAHEALIDGVSDVLAESIAPMRERLPEVSNPAHLRDIVQEVRGQWGL